MHTEASVVSLWEKTKPHNFALAKVYSECLHSLLSQPKDLWFEEPFERRKKSGGTRVIVPAKAPLRTIHWILAKWIRRTVSNYDYGISLGSIQAARMHKLFTGGICIDLKSAYDQVTEAQVRARFRGILDSDALYLFSDLVTLNGKLPQGCSSSPYVFNAVFGPIDLRLEELKKKHQGIVAVTRYVDNICISVNCSRRSLLDRIADETVAILSGRGFHGRLQKFNRPPLDYLGLYVYPTEITLNDKKLSEIVTKVIRAGRRKTPSNCRRSVMGCLNWVLRVYGDRVPEEITTMFEDYFEKAGPVPEKLVKIRSEKLV